MKPGMDLLVFVYGTLKPGGSNWAGFCEGRVAANRPARVRGKLFHYPPGYPGLVVEGSEAKTQNSKLKTRNESAAWVRGFILVLRDEAALQHFDELEEFDARRPAADNTYQRVRIACFADDGKLQPAPLGEVWTYVMTPEKLAQLGGEAYRGEVWQEPPGWQR